MINEERVLPDFIEVSYSEYGKIMDRIWELKKKYGEKIIHAAIRSNEGYFDDFSDEKESTFSVHKNVFDFLKALDEIEEKYPEWT